MVDGRKYGKLDRVYSAYLDELNPRANDDVQLALAASGDIRFKEFLERINMPKYRRASLATIAKACNITLSEFNNWWNRASTQRAIAVAQVGSVMITRDIVEDARTQDVFCPRCDGLGFIAAQPGLPADTPGYRMLEPQDGDETLRYIRNCPQCKTEKVVKRVGDAHARDKVLELSGLIKKGAAVQIVQNFSGASHSSALSGLDDLNIIDAASEEI
jgi:hypothetical protein